jgi:cytochrome c oxidase subunit 2
MNTYKVNFGFIYNGLQLIFKRLTLQCINKFILVSPNLIIITQFDCERAYAKQVGFQVPATPVMEGIIDFHHDLVFFLAFILGFVVWFLSLIVYNFSNPLLPSDTRKLVRTYSRNTHGLVLEIIWTILPACILVSIVLPSFALIYSMDEFFLHPRITLKAIGNQWYWTYNYGCSLLGIASDTTEKRKFVSHHMALKFDSYMLPDSEIRFPQLRLLEVDKRVLIPSKSGIRLLVSSYDVLHSWAVPSLGIKLDGCPGRLNQTFLFVKWDGVFYGQCSEICGVNHGFMPIVVRALPLLDFNFWLARRISACHSIVDSVGTTRRMQVYKISNLSTEVNAADKLKKDAENLLGPIATKLDITTFPEPRPGKTPNFIIGNSKAAYIRTA